MNVLDVVAGALVLCGSVLALTAAIGVVRFPDTLSRMHAASKPQTLGLLLVLTGAGLRLRGHADVGMGTRARWPARSGDDWRRDLLFSEHDRSACS